MREEYLKLLHSGMFWEVHPELTGNWEKDKATWIDIVSRRNGITQSNTIELKITASKINQNGDTINRDYIVATTSDLNPMYTTVDYADEVNGMQPLPREEIVMMLETVLQSINGNNIEDDGE